MTEHTHTARGERWAKDAEQTDTEQQPAETEEDK